MQLVHEVPIKLEEPNGIGETVDVFRIAFGFSDEATDVFSQDAVEVLDIGRFDGGACWISIDYAMHFVDDTTAFSNLDKLPVVDGVGSVEFCKNDRIVIIAVGEKREGIGECRWINSRRELSHHLPTFPPISLPDGIRYEEV